MRYPANNFTISGWLILLSLLSLPAVSQAGVLTCPDASEDVHHQDVLATSAPEIRVHADAQNDEGRWVKIIRPLTIKAIKQAKAQRAINIEDEVEHGCPASQQYVAQLLPVPDQASGCEHRIVTRSGEAGVVWVQVIAVCKYQWSCCTTGTAKSASYSLEGPLNPKPGDTKPSATTPSASTANSVSNAASTAAPMNPVKH